jgi:hypothetical protein
MPRRKKNKKRDGFKPPKGRMDDDEEDKGDIWETSKYRGLYGRKKHFFSKHEVVSISEETRQKYKISKNAKYRSHKKSKK